MPIPVCGYLSHRGMILKFMTALEAHRKAGNNGTYIGFVLGNTATFNKKEIVSSQLLYIPADQSEASSSSSSLPSSLLSKLLPLLLAPSPSLLLPSTHF